MLFLVGCSTVSPDASAQCAPGASPYSDPRVVQSVAGQPLIVRLRAEACAAVLSPPVTTLTGNVYQFSHFTDRVLPCGGIERDVDFVLPALPAGGYILRYAPEPPISLVCYPWTDVPFGVAPPIAAAVPATVPLAGGLLAFVLLLLGWSTLRVRS